MICATLTPDLGPEVQRPLGKTSLEQYWRNHISAVSSYLTEAVIHMPGDLRHASFRAVIKVRSKEKCKEEKK